MTAYLDELRHALRVQAVALRVPDQDGNALVLLATSAASGARLRFTPRLSLAYGVASRAFLARSPIVANDYAADPLAEPDFRSQEAGSVLALPVMAADTPLAMLSFVARRPGHFTPSRVQRAVALAGCLRALLRASHLAEALSSEVERGQRRLEAFRNVVNVAREMVDGLMLVDSEGRVVYCNPHADPLCGSAPEEAVGRPLAELLREKAGDLEDPGAVDRLVHLLGALSERTTIEICVVRPRRQDLAVTVFPVGGGEMTGLLIRDATSERELDRRKDAFVSIASHELRTPMTTMVGFTELLLKREVAPERRRAWLQEVYDESRRLAAILDDLLNVSLIHSGKLQLRCEQLSVIQVAEAVVESLKHPSGQHQFAVAVPGDVPAVWADRDKVKQVLMNLLSNAVKYSPRGGKVRVAAVHDAQRRRVVVSVRDEGIGIAPEDQKELFTCFHRIRRPETEGIRGTGLGLYIVKALVELMQGEVRVESELDKGSTFYFTLPTEHDDILGAGGG